MRMIMKLMDGKNMSERDFLDLINSQFGDAGKAELERLMKSGMTMQVYCRNISHISFRRKLRKSLLIKKPQGTTNVRVKLRGNTNVRVKLKKKSSIVDNELFCKEKKAS